MYGIRFSSYVLETTFGIKSPDRIGMDFGIIGGQDGPTATLVGGDPVGAALMLLLAAAVIGGAVWLFWRRHKK